MITIMLILFILQISVGITGVIKGKDLFTYGYGYAVWSCIPISFVYLLGE